MLIDITLFALFTSLLLSYCKAKLLRRCCYFLVGLFVLFQLVIIKIKQDFAGYIDYEEAYYAFKALQSDPSSQFSGVWFSEFLSLSNLSDWYGIIVSALLITLLITLLIALQTKLLSRFSALRLGAISLPALVIVSLGFVSFISSIALYRYTFVTARTLVANMLTADNALEGDTASIFNLASNNNDNNKTSSTTDVMAALRATYFGSDYSVIAHATGGNLALNHPPQVASVTGVTDNIVSLRYSNSLQALNYAIKDGKKLIEVDLISTSDGVLIGGHDWPRVKAIIGYNGEYDRNKQNASPLSFAEFTRLRDVSDVQPLDIMQINTLFTRHPHLVLITDKTLDYSTLVKHYPHTDRLIVECFSLFQCKRAKKYGIKHVALNVHTHNRDLVNYLQRNNINIVTYRGVTAQDDVAYTNAVNINKAGIVTLVYTASDDLDYIKQNIGITASAIYTDYFDLTSGTLTREVTR